MNDTKYGIGAHHIVYPKKDGIVNSIRWEETRNGLQDYEYLWLLEQKIQKIKERAGDALSWIDAKRRGVEISSKVIRKMDDFTRDPKVLYGAKKQIIAEILDLDVSPKLIVQTDPPEGSRMPYGPAVLELFGWTEPGTEITANGKKLPVSAEGVFIESVSISPSSNFLKVTAKNKNGSKEVIRYFNVVY